MARICTLCQRKALKGNTRSHSNIATKCRRHLNLQKTKINGQTVKVCTSCLKTMSKPR